MKKWKIILTTVLIGLIVARAGAGPTYWQAGTDNWGTGTNWSGGEPTASDYAYINNGGTAEITLVGELCDYLYLGQDPGESGSVELSGDGQLSTDQEYVGYEGTGTFSQSGGTHTVNVRFELASQDGSSGTYSLSGGQLSALGEMIGYRGTGAFTQTGGTNTVSSDLSLGDESLGAIGTYELSGTGQLWANYEQVGYDGTGAFTQTGGTHTVSSDLCLGKELGSDGTYTISGGTLDVNGSFYVGAGTGQFTITGDDPVIDLASFIQNDNGTLSSQFDADGIATIDVSGAATLDGVWNVVDLGGAPLGTFDILVAIGGISGAFDAINLPDGNWSWGISSSSSETLWVQHVPEPATLGMLLIGGLALLSRRRK